LFSVGNALYQWVHSYRQGTDSAFSERLALLLNQQRKQDGTVVHAFLDGHCLQKGKPWEEGFLYGLRNSKVILLVCSDAALRKVKKANKNIDNMLLEVLFF
jgi:hypothetical protein